MKVEGKIKWYQCKRDLSITVIILLIFGVAMLHFDIYEGFRTNVWVALKLKTGIYPNMIINLFFEWGFWLPAFAVFIASIFVCLKHYWSWLLITLLGVSFFLTIYCSNYSEGTIEVLDILIREFKDMSCTISFIEDVFSYALFSLPFAMLICIIVLVIRKKYENNQGV